MDQKMMVNLIAALVPIVIGAIWYAPFVFGNILKKANGNAGKPAQSAAVMAAGLIFTYIGSYFIASHVLGSIVIHQRGLFSMLAGNPDVHTQGTELYGHVNWIIDKFGTNYRTFKHGMLHGGFTGLYLVFSILGSIAIFEPKSWIWVAVHSIYWILCLTIMGGIICAYMPMTY
jgi:hypothetical protein